MANTVANNVSSLAKQLKPYWQGDIDITLSRRGVSGTGAGGNGAGGALTAHDISGPFHTGTLANSQGPQFLLTDGSRTLTGDLPVSDGVTIDDVDLSAHVADPNAHHFRATAGTGIDVSAEQEISVDEAYPFTWTAEHTFQADIQLDANLDFIGPQSITSTTGTDLTLAPGADLMLSPGAEVFLADAPDFRTVSFIDSPIKITGFRFFPLSGNRRQLTVSTLKADELHVRVFVADETRVSRAETFLSYSYGFLANNAADPLEDSVGFTIPMGTVYPYTLSGLAFEDSPAIVGQIFGTNHWVRFTIVDMESGGIDSYRIEGRVTNYVDNGDGTQNWDYQIIYGPPAAAADIVVKAGAYCVDFGVSGQSFIHETVLEESGGPFMSIQSWTGSNPTDGTIFEHVRVGKLDSVSDLDFDFGSNNYGFYSNNAYLKGTVRTVETILNDDGISLLHPEAPGTTLTGHASMRWWPDLNDQTGTAVAEIAAHTDTLTGGVHTDHALFRLDKRPSSSSAELTLNVTGTAGDFAFIALSSNNLMEIEAWDGIQFHGDLIPWADLGNDLGTASKRWRNLYVNELFVSGSISGETLSGAEWEHIGTGMIIDANNAANTIVTVTNQGTGSVTLSVEGNITLPIGATVDGVDIGAHNASPSAHHALATAGSGITVSGAQVVAVDATVVRTTRTITAGDGLSGGGTLAVDRTFDVDATVVRSTRQIVSGFGLTGGGDLSVNRTLAVGEGDGITVIEDAVSVDSTVVRTSRTLTAGDGLSGGGTLAFDRTFTVNSGDGIEIVADAVAVELHTNAGLEFSGGAVRLGAPTTLTVSSINSVTTNTHSHDITSTADASGISVSTLLHATSAGGLTLGTLLVQGNVDILSGGDLTVGSNVIFADVSQNSVGFGRIPDPQFMVDVNGPLRADYLIGKHAIQLKDAVFIAHYDGSEQSDAGEINGHMGQVGTVTGRAVFVRGKYGKALSIGPVSTGMVTNPSFETDLTSWTAETGTLTRLAPEEAAHGQYVGHYTSPSAATGVVYAAASATTAGTALGFNVWLRGEATTTACRIALQNAGRSVTYGQVSITVTPEWKMYSVFGTVAVGQTSVIGVVIVDDVSSVILIDAAQIVSGYGYAIPFVPGNRTTMTYVDYTISGVRNDRGTVMVWVRPWSIQSAGGYVLRLGQSTATRHELYFNASGTVQGIVGTAARISTTVPTVGEWTHLALTWERGTAQLYINGSPEGAAFSYVTTATPSTLRIGNNTATLHGEVEDVVLLARASSADEVRAVYESDAPVFAESSVFTFRATPKGLVWADEEGLWIKDADGYSVAGFYGGEAVGKSWAGTSLDAGDIFFGRYGSSSPAAGGWLRFDRDGYVSQPLLSLGHGADTVLEITSAAAKLTGANLEIVNSTGDEFLGVFATSPAGGTWAGATGVAAGDVIIGDYGRGNAIFWDDSAAALYIGNPTASGNYLSIGPSTFNLYRAAFPRLRLDATGILTIRDSGGNPVFTFDASAGAEFTKPLTLTVETTPGTGGGIYQGTGSFASPTTGLKIYNTSGIGRLTTYSATTPQIDITTTGKLTAGAGVVTLDAAGITVTRHASAATDINAYVFAASGVTKASIHNYVTGGINNFVIETDDASAANAMLIRNNTPISSNGTLHIVQTVVAGGDENELLFLTNGVSTRSAKLRSLGTIYLDAPTLDINPIYATSGRVGIGTSTPTANEAQSRLTVSATDSASNYLRVENLGTGQAGLVLERMAGTASRWIVYTPSASTHLRFYNAGDQMLLTATGVLQPMGGLNLGNETLTTYDQGTWTPDITGATSNPTVTYTEQLGKYTQIGNVVFYTLRITINAYSGGSGTLRISLPIACAAGNINTTTASLRTSGVDFTTPVSVLFGPIPGQSYGQIFSVVDNGANVAEAVTALATGDILIASGFYFVS